TQAQTLKRYLRKDYSTKLTINPLGQAVHNPCISHCLQHAFGNCNLVHPEICEDCEKLFTFFDEIKTNTPLEIHELLNEYQTKLLTHTIKRCVKMGHDIESGEEIQEAIKDLAGTHVANIMPNRE
ncbi:1432_t:CDS:2, partial [Racocetra persica]